jgi:hypothetical protein
VELCSRKQTAIETAPQAGAIVRTVVARAAHLLSIAIQAGLFSEAMGNTTDRYK